MYLKELIEYLEACDPEVVVPVGFNNPHSYRGYYECLAFEPAPNVTIGSMLADARSALGQTYTGYKGGEYTMGEYTDVYLAEWGDTGDAIGTVLLDYMVRQAGLIAALKKIHDTARSWEGRSDAPFWNLGDIAAAALVKAAS